MSNELVTIYVPSRNYGKYLAQCLASIEQQTYPHWEVILFNEASDDDTDNICRAFVSEHPKKARYVNNTSNIGLQKIGNLALKMSRGQFLMRVDADDYLDEAALLVLTDKMRSDPSASLVFGNFYLVDETGKIIGVENRKQDPVANGLGRDMPAHGACTLVRTRSLKIMGGYNEKVTAQDGWDLWFKMLANGKAIHSQTAIFYYRQHRASLSNDKTRLINARNTILEQLTPSADEQYALKIVGVIPIKRNAFDGILKSKLTVHLNEQIRIAKSSGVFEKLLISIETEQTYQELKDIIRDKDVVVFLRDNSLIEHNRVPIRDILYEAGNVYTKHNGLTPDIVFFLNSNSVGREPEDIKACMNMLKITSAGTVLSVEEERSPMLGMGKEGLEIVNPGRFAEITLHQEQMLRFNGSIIGCWWPIICNNTIFSTQICASEQVRGKITLIR